MSIKNNYRWAICALLFFATTINYLDRAVISFLKSTLSIELSWNDADYANVEIAFKIAYAIGLLAAGRFIDKLGTKKGYLLATGFWSVSAMAHAFVTSVSGFSAVRAALGLSEAGNFPAAIKAVAEWFPKKERALATGIFNSGANIGAILAPLSVPFINEAWGWQAAFIITGALGLSWLVLWVIFYNPPASQKGLSSTELAYITGDREMETGKPANETKISFFRLLTFRQTWAFAIGKFLTDPIWWFYLFWLPDFLEGQYGLKGTELVWPAAFVYTVSVAGSVGGGWLPLQFMKQGMPVFRARKKSMLIFAWCVLPILFAQSAGNINMWFAITIIAIAAAAHQAWSANIFTTVSDMFPQMATASVTGIGGMFGAVGGILLSAAVQKNLFVHFRAIGKIETAYYIMFIVCGLAYICAWLILHLLVPKMDPIKV